MKYFKNLFNRANRIYVDTTVNKLLMLLVVTILYYRYSMLSDFQDL